MESDQIVTSTRRRLLGLAAGATGVALATTVLSPSQAAAAGPGGASPASPVTSAAGGRATTVTRPALELGGVLQGALRGVEGGDTYADVIVESTGLKHIGLPKLEDFIVDVNFGLGPDFDRWIVKMVDGGEQESRSGVVLMLDLNRAVTSARGFQAAQLTEVTIPGCDASSKGTGFITATFMAGQASDITRAGTITVGVGQKAWLPSNFKLEIDGLDCTKVSKIEAITIKRHATDPSRCDYPNLAITLAASSAASWKTWFNDFVITGNNAQSNEKNGRIRFLSPTLTELAVLELHHLGIYLLDPDNEPAASGNGIALVRAELYVEAMNFTKFGSYTLT